MKSARHHVLYLMLAITPAIAEETQQYQFAEPELQQQYDSLLHQLRCLVCQNQSLADSAADLASDLRQDVYQMVAAGKSNEHIVSVLTARYGDFVSYKPPLKATTTVLWFAPPLLLLLALALAWRALRKPEVAESEYDQ